MNVEAMIVREEGKKYEAYPDPLTHGAPYTIGIGHTGPDIVKGVVWTDEQIEAQFELDVAIARRHCEEHFDWFGLLNEPRQAVLISMCFQMGPNRLLGFKGALGAMRDQRWPQAAGEMLDSAWAKQTPQRASRAARQMETGEWS